MSCDKPLSGKRIVVTRAPEQSQALVSALEAKGARVSLLPLVSFAPPEDWSFLDEQLQKLSGFDAILFVSQNAVRYVLQRCRELGIDCRFSAPKRPCIATVGRATERALKEEGVSVDCVAKGNTAASLVHELAERLAGKNVFLPRGNRRDDELPDALRRVGAQVTEVIAYRALAPERVSPPILAGIRAGAVDAVVFASPSAFHNFCDLIRRAELTLISERVQFAAIGPTTARAIRNFGARVAIEAPEPSATAIADALAGYFESQAAKTRPA